MNGSYETVQWKDGKRTDKGLSQRSCPSLSQVAGVQSRINSLILSLTIGLSSVAHSELNLEMEQASPAHSVVVLILLGLLH